MFGRRKREDVAQAEEAREAERRALFEQLAKRPETVCPFLGLADDRAGYQPEPNDEHRCYAFGDPAPLSDEQQRHVCLERGYSNCPRYLRGVLVIPTEELEALRRPQPHVAPPPPPPPRPVAPRRRRNLLVLVPLLILLVAAIGTGGLYLTNPGFIVGLLPGRSPTPSAVATVIATSTATASAVPSATPSATAQTSGLVTPTPLPTPTTGDVFIGYRVEVGPQAYTLYHVDGAGNITGTLGTSFSHFSHAAVDAPVTAPNGLRYWSTADGSLQGWAYIKGRSGSFQILKLYRAPDGSLRGTVLPANQV